MMEAIAPLVVLIFGAYLSYAMGRVELVFKKKHLAAYTAIFFFISATVIQLVLALQVWDSGPLTCTVGGTMLRMDALSVLLAIITLVLGTAICIYSVKYMENDNGQEYYYTLLLLMVAGIVGIGLATDLLVLYLFFELMSIPSFALVAFRRYEWMAIEAGMKYIVMSAVGSALAFFGISLIYIQTHTLVFNELAGHLTMHPVLQIATVFLIAGFGVKAAIVPLHTWLPDAHSVAPSSISAMLSGIIIGAGFFTLLRALLIFTVNGIALGVGEVLIVMALITMTVGNLMAFVQFTHQKKVELKRILAYSSVAQMGYIILGIGVGLAYGSSTGYLGYEGGLFHIMTHAFMKGLAFLCAGVIIHQLGTKYVDDMRGVGLSMKFTGFVFALSLLSLAGIPPLSGFMSEWMIFSSSIMTYSIIGLWGIAIAAIALINTLIALGYYLPIIKTMYLGAEKMKVSAARDPSWSMILAMGILATLTIVLGVWPELGLKVVEPAVKILMAGGL
jgi:proton-translocating NADH-quinone oxidoreductase chain N